MRFHFLFFTITITKRKRSQEELLHEARVQQIYDEVKERQAAFYRPR